MIVPLRGNFLLNIKQTSLGRRLVLIEILFGLNIKQLGLGGRLLLLENIGFSGRDSNTL